MFILLLKEIHFSPTMDTYLYLKILHRFARIQLTNFLRKVVTEVSSISSLLGNFIYVTRRKEMVDLFSSEYHLLFVYYTLLQLLLGNIYTMITYR